MHKKIILTLILVISLLTSLMLPALNGQEIINKINYTYSVERQDGTQNGIDVNTPNNINDGNLGTITEIIYSVPYDEGTGLLNESFYIYVDLKETYDLDKISIKWYPTSGRCVKYIISASTDGNNYTEIANHFDNVTNSDTIVDDNLNAKARFLRLEIFGNFRSSDNTKNGYFIISELTVGGTLDLYKPRPLAYTVSLSEREGADGVITQPNISVYPVNHLYDNNTSTLYEIQYSGGFNENKQLINPFYITLDLGQVHGLSSLELVPYLGIKGLKYKLAFSKDGLNYTKSFDHSDLTVIKAITDIFDEGTRARYIRIEVFGCFNSSLAYNNLTYISEIRLRGYSLEDQIIDHIGNQIRTVLVPYKNKEGQIIDGQYRQGLRFAFDLPEIDEAVSYNDNTYTVTGRGALVALASNVLDPEEMIIGGTVVKMVNQTSLVAYGSYLSAYIYNIPHERIEEDISVRPYLVCTDENNNVSYIYGDIVTSNLAEVFRQMDDISKMSYDALDWFN